MFPRDAVLAADEYPCDFLLPYIKGSLQEAAGLSRRLGHIKASSDRNPSAFDWEWNQSNYRDLQRSRSTISKYLERNYPSPFQTKPRLNIFLQDYDFLIQESRENASQLQAFLQNYTGKQAIKEAQKSLEQADAVRRYDKFCLPDIESES
jgi:hypothetical protein